MVPIAIIIIIITVVIIRDFNAWLEGYANKSYYLDKKRVHAERRFSKGERESWLWSIPLSVGAGHLISHSLNFGIGKMGLIMC